MVNMPKTKTLTVRRVLALLLAYVTLCLAGGVVSATMLVPAVFAANSLTQKIAPSLNVEGIDFNVTSLPQKSLLYASDGKTVIASFYAQNRTVVPLKQISKYMQQAVVAREDKRFFEHSGVDVQGLLRAFVQTYIAKNNVQGGSTLTQQYVKNVLLVQAMESNDPIAEYHASEDTIARKLREMLIAVQMEKQYSKAEILQGYLNIAQFGSNNLYGVETAAKRYFNVTAAQLNIVQSATIAAITKNPAQFDPSIPANQQRAQDQRNIVLDLMLQQGYITKKQHDDARAIPLQKTLSLQSAASAVGCQAAGDAAFYCDYVTKQILNSTAFGKTLAERQKLLDEGGLNIYTTMDVHANAAAMQSARNTVPVNDPSGFEVAIAAIKPGTGEVLGFGLNRTYDATIAGKNDPTHTAINFAVDEKDGGGMGTGVGSTWKPINMVAWMQSGKSINQSLATSTRYNKSSFNCNGYAFSGTWSVQNSGGGTVNPETPLQGLIHSHNTIQASMASQTGLCAVADAAKALGYNNSPLGKESVYDPNSFNPPMTIGAVQASPLTMANVFATIAANGVECTPIALKKVIGKDGTQFKVPSANCHQAISPQIAQTTAYALNQGVVIPSGEAATTQLNGGRKTFAKTGTNEDNAMTTGGFVPQVAAFVTVANVVGLQGTAQQQAQEVTFNGKTINGQYRSSWYGMYIATPAWKEFMNNYLAQANIPIDNNYGNPDSKYLGQTSAASGQSSTGTQSGTTQSSSPAAGH